MAAYVHAHRRAHKSSLRPENWQVEKTKSHLRKVDSMRAFRNSTYAVLVAAACSLFPESVQADQAVLVQDSYFIQGISTNHGAEQAIIVGGSSSAEGLIQFDLSTIPTGATVAKATLILFAERIGNGSSINIAVANGPWTESGVTGQNNPVPGISVANGVVVSADEFVKVDVTTAVTKWLAGSIPNAGFIISPATSSTLVDFDSKENQTTSHQAVLDISLTGPVGPTGATGATGAVGPIGPPGATTFAKCLFGYSQPSNSQLGNQPGYVPVSCGCSKPLSVAPVGNGSSCSVTSTAGSCSATSAQADPALSVKATFGACCVCSPN